LVADYAIIMIVLAVYISYVEAFDDLAKTELPYNVMTLLNE